MMPKRKILSLTDVDDAVIEFTNAVSFRPELLQYTQMSTGKDHKCSVCGQPTNHFWTMNRPFVTNKGGKLLPAWTLVCMVHRWAPADTAEDYEEPPETETDQDEQQDQTQDQEQAGDAEADSAPAAAGSEADASIDGQGQGDDESGPEATDRPADSGADRTQDQDDRPDADDSGQDETAIPPA